jgi:hypothetical protein
MVALRPPRSKRGRGAGGRSASAMPLSGGTCVAAGRGRRSAERPRSRAAPSRGVRATAWAFRRTSAFGGESHDTVFGAPLGARPAGVYSQQRGTGIWTAWRLRGTAQDPHTGSSFPERGQACTVALFDVQRTHAVGRLPARNLSRLLVPRPSRDPHPPLRGRIQGHLLRWHRAEERGPGARRGLQGWRPELRWW